MSQASALLGRLALPGWLLGLPRPVLLAIGPAVAAVLVTLLLWARGPAYSVLFSNIDDQDGSAIVSALEQLNTPYRFDASGSRILVPEDRVHETRIHLAGQGLPRTGSAGFELLDKARFGASQFSEQLTWQRALEGELANSIRTIQSIEQARVHLAIPRESLFIRDRQEPTASVLINLHPGRSLSGAQVAAIAWLVSSSVPGLHPDKVSVLDQNGKLLSTPDRPYGSGTDGQDHVAGIEHRTVQRIISLLAPMLGPDNVRAEASADVDFSHREQTSETYRPNQEPGAAAVRSKQVSEAASDTGLLASGIPGALSNQPPAPVEAPLTATDEVATGATTTHQQQASQTDRSGRHDATINYEVDRTIQHIKEPGARLRRLSVAVVINYQKNTSGQQVALANDELEQIERLVKEAMGYSEQRGDSLSIVNSRFSAPERPTIELWENPQYQALALLVLKYLASALIVLFIWLKVIKPLLTALPQRTRPAALAASDEKTHEAQAALKAAEISRHEDNVRVARDLATKDPRAVAMVLRSWMEKNGKP